MLSHATRSTGHPFRRETRFSELKEGHMDDRKIDGMTGGWIAPGDGVSIGTPLTDRLQRLHFVYYDLLPLLACGVLLAGAAAGYVSLPMGGFEVALFLVFWLLTGLGITVGYHRLLTHRAFKAAPWLRATLAIAGSMAAQGTAVSWVALHRLHHERTDQPGDPHSPNGHGNGLNNRFRGLVHAHYLWMSKFPYPNVTRYAPDLLRDRQLQRISRPYHWWVLLGFALPAALGGLYHHSFAGALAGLLWGGLLRLVIVQHLTWGINSLHHTFGSRPYETRESSRNVAVLSLLTLGESWHNNHHQFPNSPAFALRWYRPDAGYWFIRVMAALGAATDLRLPNRDEVFTMTSAHKRATVSRNAGE